VVDIGGRSTEMILGRRPHARTVAESFAVGCVSLSMRYFPGGAHAEGFRAAQVAAGAELEEACSRSRRALAQALGSSGTAGAVSQMLQAAAQRRPHHAEGLRWCIERCIEPATSTASICRA
jgi:exopolyphosphatase/guanosine-5'-triphosphate,3'-diphosphate pyrophosphatase